MNPSDEEPSARSGEGGCSKKHAAKQAGQQSRKRQRVHQPRRQLCALDAPDRMNPQCMAEYAEQVNQHRQEVETKYAPSPEYMSRQSHINARMRAILIDWLVEVHCKFELSPQTLSLGIGFLDRFLSREIIPRAKLQLCGCVAMHLAAKFEELYAPMFADWVYICNKAYDEKEVLEMEMLMLNTLEYRMSMPTVHSFLARFTKASAKSCQTRCEESQKRTTRCCFYMKNLFFVGDLGRIKNQE